MVKGKYSTTLGNVEMESCICNASGPRCTQFDELKKIDESQSCMVLSKSATLELRQGNPEPRYWENSKGSINSMGLPNNGIDFYLSVRKQFSKPYFISISGLCLEENVSILDRIKLNPDGVAGLEINLSCPNIVGKGQLAYDFKMMDDYLEEIFKNLDLLKDTKSIGVKLPPYFDFWQFESAAEVLMKYPLDYITCINSIGNGLIIDIDTEQTVIKPKNGFGGIGGSFVKPTGLANVRKFYEIFQREGSGIKIVGCGGVESGKDVFEYILCGAEVVQIGTQFYKEGKRCFSRLEEELGDIMSEKGYKNLDDFRGKLKNI
jgi:dihydroorotate dehydrogenase (fumarate)